MSYAQRMHQGLAPDRSMMNKGGGGGGSSTTVQEIPAELKPLATQYTNSAINLSNTPYQPYYGQRYADLNPTQFMSMGMTADRALNGSPVINSASNYVQKLTDGQVKNPYSGANPYLDNAINRSMDDVQTRVNSQFGGSNYGTSANQEVLGRELGNVSSNMRMQDYGMQQQLAESGMNRQLQGAGMAQQLGNQQYMDASQLLGVGQTLQDQQQQGLDFNYQQYLDQQNLPYKNLAAMSGVFGSNLGGTSTTQQSSGGGK